MTPYTRWSQLLIPTLKESPADAEIASHRLMIRAGMIRKIASGVYTVLPLGMRVLQKVETIVREEMTRCGALEVGMPMVIPGSLWKESGRWDHYGPELLRFYDRHQNPFCLGPTHEEVVVDVVRQTVQSYRQLPLVLYQIQSKFRDEIRPRFGMMRAREFVMKDAYSFHDSDESLDATYAAMRAAYTAIFKRCGLDFRVVQADSGSIGGDVSAEFSVLADTGEDALVVCQSCDYAANQEAAVSAWSAPTASTAVTTGVSAAPQLVETPGVKTAPEVAQFLGCDVASIIKTMVYQHQDTGAFVLIACPGDRVINEIKLTRTIGDLRLVPSDELSAKGVVPGFLGPIGFPLPATLWLDRTVLGITQGVVGANQPDRHWGGVLPIRDLGAYQVADLIMAQEGDACAHCGGPLTGLRGIETGHIFKLGTTYSAMMGAQFATERGDNQPYIMGCYGIGIGRTVAAAIEQHHDDKGIVWPVAIAPYVAVILLANPADEAMMGVAHTMGSALMANGWDVLLDDRTDSMGVKFKDAELIGFPLMMVVGKSFQRTGCIEVTHRASGQTHHVPPDQVVAQVAALLNQMETTA